VRQCIDSLRPKIEQPNPLLVVSFPLILNPKIDFLLSSHVLHSSDKDDTTHILNVAAGIYAAQGKDVLNLAVDFDQEIVWIKWIGRHGEYDKIDVTEVKYERA
jgi:hypothetical protein